MLNSLRKTYNDFPPLFWIIVATYFIDSIGSTLLFPFFALYITERFGVGMTQAGILLGMSSLFGLVGSLIGGALTDRIGRRPLILFGLVLSGLSSLMFGLASSYSLLYILVIFVGLLSKVAAPAQDADLARRQILERRLHRGDRLAAGVLHQHDRRQADVVDGLAIGLAHLLGVEYSHPSSCSMTDRADEISCPARSTADSPRAPIGRARWWR